MIDTIDIASYTDDNIPYSVGQNQCDLDKCHFLSSPDISTKFLLVY